MGEYLKKYEVSEVVESLVDEVGARGVDGLDVPARLPRGRDAHALDLYHGIGANPGRPVLELHPAVPVYQKDGGGQVGTKGQHALPNELLAGHKLLVGWKIEDL